MGEEVSLAAMSAAPALHPQLAKQLAGRQHVPLQPDCGAQALGVARKCSLTSTASWGLQSNTLCAVQVPQQPVQDRCPLCWAPSEARGHGGLHRGQV